MAQQYPCNVCTRSFSRRKDLETHCQDAHTIYGIKCRHCDKKFNSVAELLQHQKDSHGGANRGNSESENSPKEAGNTIPGGGGTPTKTSTATQSAGDGGYAPSSGSGSGSSGGGSANSS